MGALVPGPHQADLAARVAEIFASRTRAEWEAFASERDCCLEPVLTPVEAMADAHAQARGLFFRMASPWGEIDQMRLPFSPAAPGLPPPRQGEHTDEILREAGLDDARIASLRAAGVLGG
jgi:crotonobetainyl-CoA:carnitine CoA-transferase CaiB-like acyl-CoA transferase